MADFCFNLCMVRMGRKKLKRFWLWLNKKNYNLVNKNLFPIKSMYPHFSISFLYSLYRIGKPPNMIMHEFHWQAKVRQKCSCRIKNIFFFFQMKKYALNHSEINYTKCASLDLECKNVAILYMLFIRKAKTWRSVSNG